MISRRIRTLAALLALAVPAAAQDKPADGPAPPAPGTPAPAEPAKEPAAPTPKVTEAARKALETIRKLLHNPAESGLKTLEATIEMSIDMGEAAGANAGAPSMGMKFHVLYESPASIDVKPEGGEMFGPGGAKGLGQAVANMVLNSMGYMFSKDELYDADVAEKDGKSYIAVTMLSGEAEGAKLKIHLDEVGLPKVIEATNTIEMMGKAMTTTTTFEATYVKDGERYRLTKQVIKTPMAPAPIVYSLKYSDVGGYKLPTTWTMEIEGMMTFVNKFTALKVNGKEIALADGAGGAKPSAPVATGGKKPEGDDADGKDDDEDGDDGDDDDDGDGDGDEDGDEDGMR